MWFYRSHSQEISSDISRVCITSGMINTEVEFVPKNIITTKVVNFNPKILTTIVDNAFLTSIFPEGNLQKNNKKRQLIKIKVYGAVQNMDIVCGNFSLIMRGENITICIPNKLFMSTRYFVGRPRKILIGEKLQVIMKDGGVIMF